MTQKPRKMIVVGGGTSGWMTAIYLNKLFNHARQNLNITVIESPDIGVVGVGEATVHNVRFFMAAMGLDEQEVMRETNATFKTGILFRNWMKPDDGKIHEYFHPFEQQQTGRVLDISTNWFVSGRAGKGRYDEAVCLSTELMMKGHAPKGVNSPPYSGVVPYGYHIDAILFARYLRRKAVEAGVVHIEDTVTDVIVKDRNISQILSGNNSYSADIFIDCTGFRGLLIDKLRQDNWIGFEDALPCNKAVAIQREMPEDEVARPYTTSTAMPYGWIWQIDLTNRQGTGYVYDGNRLSPEQAEEDLRSFLGLESHILKCTHLDMKIGCREEFWIGNCIAIGLSAGFIEPLESTGLHLISTGAGLLTTHLQGGKITRDVRDSYNRLMGGFFQDLKQFIVMHYCLSDRDDTDFWRAAPGTVKHCPWLEKQLDVWKHKICEFQDLAGSYSTTFSDENYRYILYGMRHFPDLEMQIDSGESARVFSEVRMMAENAILSTMTHMEALDRINS